MLADAEHIQAEPIGGLHFRQKFLHPIGGWQGPASHRIGDGRGETVDAYFYHRRFHILLRTVSLSRSTSSAASPRCASAVLRPRPRLPTVTRAILLLTEVIFLLCEITTRS